MKSSNDTTRGRKVPMGRLVLFLVIAVGGCGLDLWTKNLVFERLGCVLVGDGHAAKPVWLVNEVFGFETSLNEGALFGMGQGYVTLFAVLSIVASLGVLYWLVFAQGLRELVLTIALACVMAGIFGNLYDRLGMPQLQWSGQYSAHQQGEPVYAVRDWIHFKIDALNFDWPTFNIADSFLVCGAILLLVHGLRQQKGPPAEVS